MVFESQLVPMRELLLIQDRDRQYAVWREEIQSVREIQNLRRLPLSPACVAGVALIDGTTATLADLPACIGQCTDTSDTSDRRVLLLAGQDKPAGFVFTGKIDFLTAPDDAVLSIPDFFRTDIISSCLVIDQVPVPIVNVSLLHRIFLKADPDSGQMPAFPLPDEGRSAAAACSEVRLFRVNNSVFGTSAEGSEESTVRIGRVAPLSSLPPHMKGITVYSGRVLPVVDLAVRIEGNAGSEQHVMLVKEIGDSAFGLLVQEDLGRISLPAMTTLHLPPLAAAPWLSSAVLHHGEIIPLVDLRTLLSVQSASGEPRDRSRLYVPDSAFPEIFKGQAVEVVEFSLLGTRHAIPAAEVEDVLGFRNCRPVPEAPEIIAGIAEHRGALLPVLDLAAVFGRRSRITPEWSLVLVRNGDFQALVVTEEVYGKRLLDKDIQRDLPIMLPHQVVYGCYPDADSVRLILNVEALAVHFEKSLVSELLPALSEEMKQAAAEVIPSVLVQEMEAGKEAVEYQQTVAAGTVENPVEPAADAVAPPERPDISPSDETARELTGQEPAASAPEADVVLEESAVPPGPEIALPENEPQTAAPESVNFPEPEPTLPETGRPEPQQSEQEMGAPEEKAIQPDSEAPVVPDTAEVPEAQAEPTVETPQVEQEPVLLTRMQSGPEQEREPEPEPKPWPEPDREPQPAVMPMPSVSFKGVSDEIEKRGNRNRFAYAGIAAVLAAALVYYLIEARTSRTGQPVQEAPAVAAETVRAVPAVTAEVPEPPLVLEIPPEKPVPIDVYTVVKDDTLWSISERFTGNPFNYPRIAGQNRIANPDLIFPGQRIRLKKKQ